MRVPARWLIPLLLACATPAPAAVSIVDSRGIGLTLAAPARRIVSLTPHATELLFAAGAGEALVGVTTASDHPPAARRIARIGAYPALDLEAILALRPDLVVAWPSGQDNAQIARLRGLGIPVFHSDPRRLDDVPVEIERLGQLAGTSPVAQARARTWREQLAALRRQYSAKPPLRVFYQIWHRPPMTVNRAHIISDLIATCSGENVFAGLAGLAPNVSEEAVLAARPEVIIASGAGAERPAWLDDWQRWPLLPAVARRQLHAIDPSLLQRPGPRLLEGAAQLCALLESARLQRGQ